MTSSVIRKRFNEDVMQPPDSLLDEVLSWIQENMLPEEVFSDEEMESWAVEAGFHKF